MENRGKAGPEMISQKTSAVQSGINCPAILGIMETNLHCTVQRQFQMDPRQLEMTSICNCRWTLAFEEFSGAKNRLALLSLLAPVQHSAAQSEFVRGLVESKRIYQPQVFSAREAHEFLHGIPAFEAAGQLVRVPAWGRPARPKVKVTVGAGKPAGIRLEALMDFHAELTLDGAPVSEEEWKPPSLSQKARFLPTR